MINKANVMDESIKEFEKEMRTLSWETLKAGRKILKNYKMTDLQFDVLVTLYFNKDINTLTEISKKLHLAKSTVSSVFDKLEKGKYISRRQLSKDKRVVKINLLKKGENMIGKVIDERVRFLRALSDNVDKSDLKNSIKTLNKLVKNISNTS